MYVHTVHWRLHTTNSNDAVWAPTHSASSLALITLRTHPLSPGAGRLRRRAAAAPQLVQRLLAAEGRQRGGVVL